MSNADFDILIVGAGLSGIGAAVHVQDKLPGKRYAILEARGAIGGTWDLFRYPGVRSDSDMHTLGYAFKPWKDEKAIADGPAILDYVRETASEYGVDSRIRFHHRVVGADWDSQSATWQVDVERADTGAHEVFTCRFLYMCSGYYSYQGGHRPHFPGEETFQGDIIHPQDWPETLDYSGKKVVVIGSGATAVTLVPAMAGQAEHVTMLQRSPTYIVSRPARDSIANGLRRWLPNKIAYGLTRWKNILFQMFFFDRARKKPDMVKSRILGMAKAELGPGFDVEKHFTPSYNPWDQRLCLVPDSDLFDALKSGAASIVTDHIEQLDETGITLTSGERLDADIIVSATGLRLVFLGGLSVSIDGVPLDPGAIMTYRGLMFEGVPNLVSTFGYTNASWTLKADLTAEFVCRLIRHMDQQGYVEARPMNDDPSIGHQPFLDFSSGYVTRAMADFPKQGTEVPWKAHQNYVRDIAALRHARLEDGKLAFRQPGDAEFMSLVSKEGSAIAAE